MNRFATIRSLFLILLLLTFSAIYLGCGGEEETMSEDEMVTDTGSYEKNDSTAENAQSQEATEEPKETQQNVTAEQAPDTVTPEVASQPAGPSNEQLQSELDSLKTENVQLQDKLTSTEQTNQDLMAKVSDLEAANMAMKEKMGQKKSRPASKATAAQPGKSSPEEIEAYKGGVSKFNAKDYDGAISEFQSLLNSGIKDDYADNCHYWIGLSDFQKKDFTSAISEFEQVMNYRFSEKKDDAQIMIARSYERLGNREKAMMEYKKLIDMFPTSEYVAKAQAKLR